MKSTYRETLEWSLRVGVELLFYSAYLDIMNGADMDDIYINRKFTVEEMEKVKQLIKDDPLQANFKKLFSFKEGDSFHLCISGSEQEAADCISKNTNEFVSRVIEVRYGLLENLYFPLIKKDMMLFEYAELFIDLPLYVGLYDPKG